MPIDFPSSPSNNQSYTYNDRVWIFNTTAGAWISQGGAVAAVGAQGPQGAAGAQGAQGATGSSTGFAKSFLIGL